MAAPGRIHVNNNQRQLLFRTDKTNARWYRIANLGPGAMGVTYTDGTGNTALSESIEVGRTMDFYASRIEIRHDAGTHVEGSYECLS